MKKVLILLGPNLNMIGTREQNVYGKESLDNIKQQILTKAKDKNLLCEVFQSNWEGALIDKIHNTGKTVVTTNGCFDILHVGHVRYLEKTKTFGDYLIVLLNSDKSVKSIKGPSRPINNEMDRAEILSALKCVDYVVLFDEDSPRNLLDEMKPDVYTKGADYTMETLPEADIMKKNGTRVEFIDFVAGKSTTKTIEKMKEA